MKYTRIYDLFLSCMRRFWSIPEGNPELLKAQYRVFSHQILLMYGILLVNTWAVAITHVAFAPTWLTIGVPILMTVGSLIRIWVWYSGITVDPPLEVAKRRLSGTNRLAGVISVAFTAWALALLPYGDAYAQSQVAFYMAITVIGVVFCMMHLRPAAFTVAIVVNGAFVGFFALSGNAVFVAIALNTALVSAAMLVVLLVHYRDFTRMVDAQTDARCREAEQSRLLRMIDDMPVAVMTVEPKSLRITYANETSKRLVRSIEHLLPVKAGELIGASIEVFQLHPERQRSILADSANLPHYARIKLGPEILDLQISGVAADNGSYLGLMFTLALVTKAVEAEKRILQLAQYDTLTGLANRNSFREQTDQIVGKPSRPASLLFIDLDGFKPINDTKGHRIGDELLRQVADRLRDVCSDQGMLIGRLGGDEFCVLVLGDDAKKAACLAGRLVAALSAPYQVEDGQQARIGASVGIAFAPADGTDAATLLSRADIALYSAKAMGKGTFRLFLPEMETRVQDRVHLEAKLRGALQSRDSLFVFYQPILCIETSRVTAREALLRWHDPKRGWIPPSEFIPVAEQSGLIDELGVFVLNSACREAAEWPDGARVAVNISAGQLGKGVLAPTVHAALVESGLSPGRLEIEVTETALLDAEKDCVGDLRRLRNLGVRIALDDFGTGYSSLAHLRAFPFDKIKIDGSFVRDAVDRPDCAAVVKAIADLGKRLGVTTVAEGVETKAHFDCVRAEGCSEVQGYLHGRPLPSAKDAARVGALDRALRDQSSGSPLGS